VKRLAVLRAIDKLDRLRAKGVMELLGAGRKDESGDFTPGAGLNYVQISRIINAVGERDDPKTGARGVVDGVTIRNLENTVEGSEVGLRGTQELWDIRAIVEAAGYSDRVKIDPSVVRGLEYYTGAVFEADLLFEIKDDSGQPVRFGSVGGGGRYDDLVARFRGESVPATGFSIGVSRLYAALKHLGRIDEGRALGPVVVLVLDRERIADYQRLVAQLRSEKINGKPIPAELYLGTAGLKAQMKYADRRGSPCVVIQGDEERSHPDGPKVQIKDLIQGAQMAEAIASREEWREARPAQFSVPEREMASAVKDVLTRYRKGG
jgi:histidyl-tRNA synthetase